MQLIPQGEPTWVPPAIMVRSGLPTVVAVVEEGLTKILVREILVSGWGNLLVPQEDSNRIPPTKTVCPGLCTVVMVTIIFQPGLSVMSSVIPVVGVATTTGQSRKMEKKNS